MSTRSRSVQSGIVSITSTLSEGLLSLLYLYQSKKLHRQPCYVMFFLFAPYIDPFVSILLTPNLGYLCRTKVGKDPSFTLFSRCSTSDLYHRVRHDRTSRVVMSVNMIIHILIFLFFILIFFSFPRHEPACTKCTPTTYILNTP